MSKEHSHIEMDDIKNGLREELESELKEQLDSIDPELLKSCVDDVLNNRLPDFRAELRVRAKKLIEERQKERQRQTQRREKKKDAVPEDTFERFNPNWRIQHMVLLSSCVILILTGIPLKFHDQSWAIFLLQSMGGLKTTGILHRIGAVGLIFIGSYHILYILTTRDGRRNLMQLLPSPKDIKDVIIQIRYYLGKSEKHARFGRFSYIEKFDYWAVYWGMVIMVGSGIILWFETNFPLTLYHIAREAHSDEALLATLAIIIWHFYNVHFNPDKFPMNRVWLTGRLTKEEMLKEHPLEYEEHLKSIIEKENDERPHSESAE